jgi:hypothetical protein
MRLPSWLPVVVAAGLLAPGIKSWAAESPAVLDASSSARASREDLLSLLSDADAAKRADAARALKAYVMDDARVETALLGVLDRYPEEDAVKREAIKSLSLPAARFPDADARKALIRIAQDERASTGLRAIAYKALYAALYRGFPDVRQALQEGLKDSNAYPEVRAGAAWALWTDAANDPGSRSALLSVAQDRNEQENLRIEAVKSLPASLFDPQARTAVLSLAQDRDQPQDLRRIAVLCLHFMVQDWAIQGYLKQAAQDEPMAALKDAAAQALDLAMDAQLRLLFHLPALPEPSDPLQNQ